MNKIKSTKKECLTVQNHLERDSRLDHLSVHGIGGFSHSTDEWVAMILSVELEISLPDFLDKMFRRAQSCMVYGCYSYPLFTLGIEELFRFGESAFAEAMKIADAPKAISRGKYFEQQEWAKSQGLMDDETARRWEASRRLRNSVSHKRGNFLLLPTDALRQLDTTKYLVENLFRNCEQEIHVQTVE